MKVDEGNHHFRVAKLRTFVETTKFLNAFLRLFVPLAYAEGTSTQKSSKNFGFSFVYSYLCTQNDRFRSDCEP